jgi:UDP-N-acetyl-D-galactosamine dehydrogenase
LETDKMMTLSEVNLCVIGLGYVGLPLAVEFGKTMQVIGFDIDEDRIQALRQSKDSTLELTPDQIRQAKKLILFKFY